jgi:hypothetical protein
MKYGTTNTFNGRQTKKHGRTVKPSLCRYFSELRWIKNAEKRKLRQLKLENKSKLKETSD